MLTIYLVIALLVWFFVFWTTACFGDTFIFSWSIGLIIGSLWPLILLWTCLYLILEGINWVIEEELSDREDD